MALILGKKKVSRETVAATETPEATDSYSPIPHIQFVEMIEQALVESGFEIVDEDFVLARHDQRFFGAFAIKRKDVNNNERCLVIGFRNSHDKSFQSAVCIGSQVMVCDNLDFSSEEEIGRRHTKLNMRDLPPLINQVIAALVSQWVSMEKRVQIYKETSLSHEQAALLFNKLAEAGAIPESKSFKCFKLWLDPSAAAEGIVDIWDYQTQDEVDAAIEQKRKELKIAFGCGSSLWGAYNAVTEILKSCDATKLAARTMQAQVICDDVAGFQASVGTTVEDSEQPHVDDTGEEEFRETFQD